MPSPPCGSRYPGSAEDNRAGRAARGAAWTGIDFTHRVGVAFMIVGAVIGMTGDLTLSRIGLLIT
ncbi:hypothetical protein [Micromonospora sp. CNB394]|uniref:hypothetical protein n=1 Tax=Micromonospora sp. CNB394 TaxID=1169151 RepID=UPI0003A44C48|nr:hypothetical protein [Micromonospora sp. CNB394]